MKRILFCTLILSIIFISCLAPKSTIELAEKKPKAVKRAVVYNEVLSILFKDHPKTFIGTRKDFFTLFKQCVCSQPLDTTLMYKPKYDLKTMKVVGHSLLGLTYAKDLPVWYQVSYINGDCTKLLFNQLKRETDHAITVRLNNRIQEEYRLEREPHGWRWRKIQL